MIKYVDNLSISHGFKFINFFMIWITLSFSISYKSFLTYLSTSIFIDFMGA